MSSLVLFVRMLIYIASTCALLGGIWADFGELWQWVLSAFALGMLGEGLRLNPSGDIDG